MEQTSSREALLEFLDYLANKGLAQKATVAARKAAVGRVFEILEPEEAADITNIDLANVMSRFQNLKGKEYTPASLSTYQSRIKKAVDDFVTFRKNPLAYRPASVTRERKAKSSADVNTPPQKAPPAPADDQGGHIHKRGHGSENSVPIPIRIDLTVFVQGIPFDLSKAEAAKIANVIMALAGD